MDGLFLKNSGGAGTRVRGSGLGDGYGPPRRSYLISITIVSPLFTASDIFV